MLSSFSQWVNELYALEMFENVLLLALFMFEASLNLPEFLDDLIFRLLETILMRTICNNPSYFSLLLYLIFQIKVKAKLHF